jgi:acetyl-CoA carboxylase biotin carboxyl carrier protein
VTITAADVAEIMRLVEQSSFDEIALEIDGIKLNLRRGGAVQSGVARQPVSAPVAPPAPPPQVAAPTLVVDPDSHAVPAPLLGTFYRAPKPGAPPFVEVGSEVAEDTVIAIIEVMKLMNAVRAGVRGTVTAILVNDGALVEYEQPLISVRKAR